MTTHISRHFIFYLSAVSLLLPYNLFAQNLGVDPFFDSIYVVAHTGVDSERVRSYCNISSMISDAPLSRRYLDTAIFINNKKPTEGNNLKIAVEEAHYFTNTANFERAYQLYKSAIPMAEKLGQHERSADLRYSVGDMLLEMERFAEAENYYLEGFEKTNWIEKNFDAIKSADNSFTDIYALYAFAYQRLANLYALMPEKKALIEPTLAKSLANAEKVHPLLAADAHVGYINYYLEEKNAAKASQTLRTLEDIFKNLGKDMLNQIPWQYDLPFFRGKLAVLNKNTEGGIVHLSEASSNYEKAGEIKKLTETYKLLSALFTEKREFEKAYAAQSKYIFYKDSLTRKEQFKTINTIETQFQTEKKQAQIELQNTEIRQKRRTQWALLAGLTLFCGLSFLLFKQNKKVTAANVKIQKQATQLELMMKELHHRVKNNLQIVSSLLSLQSFQTTDKTAAAAIQEGHNRVEAMSLIHQRLYQTREVTQLNFHTYANDLVEKLIFAYGFDPHAFDLQLNIAAENLDVDQAMPLGLILNELLTNAFKYAYKNTETPALSIDLKRIGEKWHFHLSDNGVGLNHIEKVHSKQSETTTSNGFGTQLITSLSEQLEGEYRFWNDKGLHFELVF